MTSTVLGSASIGAFDGVSLDMLVRQGFRPVPITRARPVTPNVLLVELSPAEATAPFAPGSHLEVAVPLPEGPAIRHYSLLAHADLTGSDSSGKHALQIAILREQDGRGGSAWLHDHLPDCRSLLVRGPRDTFGYRGNSPAYFVAGGIGITPITAMAEAAAAAAIDWHLLYVGRRRESMAFADDLVRAHGPEKVTVHVTEDAGRPDVVDEVRTWAGRHLSAGASAAAASGPGTGLTVYACGPVPLMHALDVGFADDPAITVVCEDFDSATSPSARTGTTASARAAGAAPAGTVPAETVRTGETAEAAKSAEPGGIASARDHSFVVELGDGSEVDVPAGCSIIDALNREGIRTLSSCRKGTCGTCETVILDGEADHRDSVLSAEEHAAQETMMICVSRACGKRIALDL